MISTIITVGKYFEDCRFRFVIFELLLVLRP